MKPKFTTEFLEAVVREAAEELTLRAEEAGAWCTFIDTKALVTQKAGSHHSWHAICQATFLGRRRSGMEDHVLQLQGAAQSGEKARNPETTRRPRCLRSLKVLISTIWAVCTASQLCVPSTVGPLGNPLEEPNVCMEQQLRISSAGRSEA